MKINRKIVSKSLLGLIGGQVLFVGVGLSRHYLSPQKDWIVNKADPSGYYQNETFCDQISNNPSQYPVWPIRSEAGEFKIYIIGATTGVSGDSVAMEFPV